MKRWTGIVPLLILAALSVASLIAVRSGWVHYGWYRIVEGRTLVISGQCLALPPGWTHVTEDQPGVHAIRRHFMGYGSENFATVLPSSAVASAVRTEISAPVVVNGLTLYDFGPNSPGGQIRFMAFSSKSSFAILASRNELLRELAANLAQCR
jgi:hypothetical protein